MKIIFHPKIKLKKYKPMKPLLNSLRCLPLSRSLLPILLAVGKPQPSGFGSSSIGSGREYDRLNEVVRRIWRSGNARQCVVGDRCVSPNEIQAGTLTARANRAVRQQGVWWTDSPHIKVRPPSRSHKGTFRNGSFPYGATISATERREIADVVAGSVEGT